MNKIPINLHYTINPMRGRQHSPFWIFSSLFPQDRSCERAPIRRMGKVPSSSNVKAPAEISLRFRISRSREAITRRSIAFPCRPPDIRERRIYSPGIRAGKYSTTVPVYALLRIPLLVTLASFFFLHHRGSDKKPIKCKSTIYYK